MKDISQCNSPQFGTAHYLEHGEDPTEGNQSGSEEEGEWIRYTYKEQAECSMTEQAEGMDLPQEECLHHQSNCQGSLLSKVKLCTFWQALTKVCQKKKKKKQRRKKRQYGTGVWK